MKKTILCLFAPSDRGKTSSIRRVDKILHSYGAKLEKTLFEEIDFCKEYLFLEHKIGLLSLGDPSSSQPDYLQNLVVDNCEVIVCASRFKGATCEEVSKIANNNQYERYWISPLYEYDRTHPLINDMHELNAKFIINAVLLAYNS